MSSSRAVTGQEHQDIAQPHTPGPWTAEDSEIFDADAHRIAGTYPRPGQTETFGAEELANARLIAAAPEIYEALRELHLKAVIGTEAERHAALDRAWAALTKAEGRA